MTPRPEPQHGTHPAEHLDHTDHDDVEHGDGADAGITTVEFLTWAALIVVVIAGLTALLQALGADVIQFVRDQIGV